MMNSPAPFCSHPSRSLAALFLLPILLLFSSCAEQSFKKGYRKLQRGKTERAEKIFKKYQKDPNYDLGAEYYLLRIHTKRARTLGEWAKADSAFAALAKRYEGISPEKAAKLKKGKASVRRVTSSRNRFQRRAIQYAERVNSIPMLDSTAKLFPEWLPKLRPDWDTARAHVVNRNLPTTDYDIATSVLNNHIDVVGTDHYKDVWAITENIWDYFEQKYPSLCRMNRFGENHDWHSYARDCWFDEARQMFCYASLDSALTFHKRYPHTALEFEVIDFILDNSPERAVARLDMAQQKQIADLRSLQKLREIFNGCEWTDSAAIRRDVYHYLTKYAPRYSAFVLLKEATSYYLQLNRQEQAFQLLRDMRPVFRDSSVCTTNFDFQTQKQLWFDKYLGCLDGGLTNLHRQSLNRWNTDNNRESSAVSWDEGDEAYFARKDAKKKTLVMRSVRENEEWSVPAPVTTLSVANKAEPLSMTADGLQMLLKIGRRLYISERDNELANWGTPVKLPYSFPALSRAVFAPDGSAIIVDASYDPANLSRKPKSNLYYCLLSPEGKYERPRSLGSVINTDGRECNPYLCTDGKTLLFCSDGHEGFGKLDVFVSRRTGDSWTSWSKPQNLGCQVNSRWDDYGFTWVPENGKSAFFTEVGKCTYDFEIRQTDLPPHARPKMFSRLRGQIANNSGKTFSRGHIEFTLNDDKEPVVVPITPTGRYNFVIPNNAEKVVVYANIPGYYTDRDTMHDLRQLTAGTTIRDTFRLRSIGEIRRYFQLKYATFDNQSTALNDPRIYKELSLLHRFAKRTKASLHFIGHTDSTGIGDKRQLSQDRAATIKRYMVETLQMPEKRLSANGRADTEPKCTNATQAGRRCNNRIEVKIDIPPAALKKTYDKTEGTDDGLTTEPVKPKKTKVNKKPKRKPTPEEPDLEPKKKRKKWWQKLIFWKNKKEKEEEETGDED